MAQQQAFSGGFVATSSLLCWQGVNFRTDFGGSFSLFQTSRWLKHFSPGRAGLGDAPEQFQSRYEWRQTFVTQIHADLVFQACISFLRYFRMPVAPTRKMLVYTGMLPCLVSS